MVECIVCAKKRPPGAFHKMECCGQNYCRECIGDQAIQELSSGLLLNNVTFKCPTASCKNKLTIDYLYNLKLPNWDEIDRQLLRKYFREKAAIKTCPKQGCEYAVESSTRCSYVCEICKTRWSDIIYTKSNPVVAEFGNMATFIEKTVLGEQCPNCEVYISKNGGCPHMVCNLCKYEFCWLCLQQFNGYAHPSVGNVCPIRMISLIFFYVVLILCICSKVSTGNSTSHLFKYIGIGILHFLISAFYVFSHGFWLGWFDAAKKCCNSAKETICLLILLTCLVMYEVFLNYVWYRYSLFVVLYQVVKVVLLIAENAALIAASTEARQPRGETRLAEIIYMILPSITMFILLFGGPEKLANQMVLIMPFMIAVMVSYRRYDTTRTASKIVRTISYIAGIAAVGYFRYWRQILVVGTFGISHLLFMKLN